MDIELATDGTFPFPAKLCVCVCAMKSVFLHDGLEKCGRAVLCWYHKPQLHREREEKKKGGKIKSVCNSLEQLISKSLAQACCFVVMFTLHVAVPFVLM